jgi:DNA-binding response OmpR family regulator
MQGWKILLVDDEKEYVSTLAERLRMRDIETDEANNGEEALRLMRSNGYTVVVLDLMMPGMSGIEVLKRIKVDHPQTQVILLTGLGAAKEAGDGVRAGAFDYLMKPVQIEELMGKIAAAMKKITGEAE